MFLVAIVGATYAYFESATSLERAEFDVNAVTAGSMTFTGYSTGTIEIEANSTSMTQANVSTNIVDQDNATITVKVDSDNEYQITTCTYDLVWVWDSEEIYTEPDIELPYEDLEGPEVLYCPPPVNNMYYDCYYRPPIYSYELSIKMGDDEEMDLSSFTWSGKEAVIANKSITNVDGEQNYEIKVQIYNIPVVQTNLFNKHLKAHIEIRNNVCSTERDYINVDPIKSISIVPGEVDETSIVNFELRDDLKNASVYYSLYEKCGKSIIDETQVTNTTFNLNSVGDDYTLLIGVKDEKGNKYKLYQVVLKRGVHFNSESGAFYYCAMGGGIPPMGTYISNWNSK